VNKADRQQSSSLGSKSAEIRTSGLERDFLKLLLIQAIPVILGSWQRSITMSMQTGTLLI
jgi:hypothetical protein